MLKLSTSQRIGLTLSLLAVSLLLLAHWVGLIPDGLAPRQAEERSHRAMCESIALHCCVAAERNDLATIEAVANLVVARNEWVDAVLVRRANGQVLARAPRQTTAEAAPHPTTTAEAMFRAGQEVSPDETVETLAKSPATEIISVPIYASQKPWGEVQVRCLLREKCFASALGGPLVLLTSFVGLGTFLAFSLYLRRVLTHLDPSAVVPERVKATLDTLAEGVVVLDEKQRVVLANEAFARAIGRPLENLCGERVSDLKWSAPQGEAGLPLPWERAVADGTAHRGEILRIDLGDNQPRTFSVNAAPILGSNRACRGVLVTFDDLTQLEQKNAKLVDLIERLQESQRQIEARNAELQYLATRDPLTGCFNRRAFFSQAESAWEAAQSADRPMAVIMADIDHFKSFNDQHGHAVGDKVLQHVARIFQAGVRKDDLVCRFGGEEFCILVSEASLPFAQAMAERMRAALESTPCDGLLVSSSLGVAVLGPAASQLRDAIEHADRSLYASKRSGRNRVTTWQQLVERGETELKPEKAERQDRTRTPQSPVSLKAVNTLFNSLLHRDRPTAEHSRRVANLCMVVGQPFLLESDLFILEAAALLHDVGKLGVPDAVLLKPGPLTAEEWKVMSQHDDISRDLVEIVFSCPELSQTVALHHAWFGGNPRDASLPTGQGIPVGARLLSICDAYDAIVSDRVYHRGRTHEQAVAELRRCAGSQFDPELVERFVATLNRQLSSNKGTNPPSEASPPSRAPSEERLSARSAGLSLSMASQDEAENVLSLASELVALCQTAGADAPQKMEPQATRE